MLNVLLLRPGQVQLAGARLLEEADHHALGGVEALRGLRIPIKRNNNQQERFLLLKCTWVEANWAPARKHTSALASINLRTKEKSISCREKINT